jgi:hypothetical protein
MAGWQTRIVRLKWTVLSSRPDVSRLRLALLARGHKLGARPV